VADGSEIWSTRAWTEWARGERVSGRGGSAKIFQDFQWFIPFSSPKEKKTGRGKVKKPDENNMLFSTAQKNYQK
jgi:hypothetical protein